MHFLTQFNQQILAVANVFIALGTVILAFGIPWSIRSARREQRDTFYTTLDQTYFEIQKTIIEHPHLFQTDPGGKTPEQIVQYDAFAFMTWNFIESIYDYAIVEADENLRRTWECILHYEAQHHGAWFSEPRNRSKFKLDFREWIEREERCAAVRDATAGPGGTNSAQGK